MYAPHLLNAAATVGTLALVGCLFGIAYIFGDIKSLNDEIMYDMQEFQVFCFVCRDSL